MSLPLVILTVGPKGWRTYESNSIDDAIGIEGAALILSHTPAIASKYRSHGRWNNADFFAVHGMMATIQRTVPMDPILVQQQLQQGVDALRDILGLSPADSSNTPNIPGDPKLFGEDDPYWYDYRPDGGRPPA